MNIVPQLVSFVVSGSASNWWGLGCPAHCSSSFTVLLLAGLAGASLGATLVLYLFRETIFLKPQAPAVDPPEVKRPAALRLRPYLHGRSAQLD